MHKNQRGNFVGQKKKKTAKRTRFQAKTAEVGCVLGAGGDESGKNRLRTDARGRHRMQHKPGKLDRIQTSLSTKNPQTMRFSQDLGTRVLCFLSKNDAPSQKRGEKSRISAGFPQFQLLIFTTFQKRCGKRSGRFETRYYKN